MVFFVSFLECLQTCGIRFIIFEVSPMFGVFVCNLCVFWKAKDDSHVAGSFQLHNYQSVFFKHERHLRIHRQEAHKEDVTHDNLL